MQLFLLVKENADDGEVTQFGGGGQFIASIGDWKSNRAKYSIVLEHHQYFVNCESLSEAVLFFFAWH